MKYLLTITILFAFNSYAHDECITHGDCQAINQTSPARTCVIVKTGTDVFGAVTCAEKCNSVQRGYQCIKHKGDRYGHCRLEKLAAKPIYNHNDPNRCNNAVDL